MDVLTHFAVPYLLMWLLRRPQAERLAAGIGGYAPDADVFTGWIGMFGSEWTFLGHRTGSHSLVLAPLYALGVMSVLCLPPWSRWFPRMAVWRFTPRLVLIAMAGSLTHLALDGVTTSGIPLLFPFTVERVSLNWFSYSVAPAFLVSSFLVYRLLRGTATEAALHGAAVALAACFVLAGTVRALTHPDVGEEALTIPGRMEWEWRVLRPVENGWETTTWSWGAPGESRLYEERVPDDPQARRAVRLAQASVHYQAHLLYSYGPQVVQVERLGDGAWSVVFLEVLGRAQADEASPFRVRGTDSEEGVLRVVVDAAGVHLVEP